MPHHPIFKSLVHPYLSYRVLSRLHLETSRSFRWPTSACLLPLCSSQRHVLPLHALRLTCRTTHADFVLFVLTVFLCAHDINSKLYFYNKYSYSAQVQHQPQPRGTERQRVASSTILLSRAAQVFNVF